MYEASPEYDTSIDNMDEVTADAIDDTFKAHLRLVQVPANNRPCLNPSPWGKPLLTKMDLYARLGAVAPKFVSGEQDWIMYLLAYSDGEQEIVDISSLAMPPTWQFASGIPALVDSGLLARKQ